MVIFPNCKINLGLRIVRKRSDGFHDLETVFYPLMVRDVLEAVTAHEEKEGIQFTQSGQSIEGKSVDNLCVKAYDILKKEFPDLPPIKLHLHKNIPIGAGLGGGSADGAFMLKLINEKFHLKLSTEQLLDRALHLGSDCPFFIINKPCYATGRGEFLQSVKLDLSVYSILLVSPDIHISTAWAFSMLKSDEPQNGSIQEIIRLPVEQWKNRLHNDFESPVFAKHPEIKEIKEKIYHTGAIYSSLSGSGSSVYGIFEKNKIPESAFAMKGCRVSIVE